MRVDFYHLTQIPLERALPSIAERVFAGGERLVVVADDDGLLDRLDTALWTFRSDSFLPHGRVGDQPILLCQPADATAAQNIALADGVWRDIALSFARAFYFFGSSTIDDARGAWRALGENSDVDRHYWKQDDAGKWVAGP